jgi:diguanylate cyclase (GGDEF)-like protein
MNVTPLPQRTCGFKVPGPLVDGKGVHGLGLTRIAGLARRRASILALVVPVVAAIACFSVIEVAREHARSADNARLQLASLGRASEQMGRIESQARADGWSSALRREFATASALLLASRQQLGVNNADNPDELSAINRRIDVFFGATRRSLARLGTVDGARDAEASEAALGDLGTTLAKASRDEGEQARVAEFQTEAAVLASLVLFVLLTTGLARAFERTRRRAAEAQAAAHEHLAHQDPLTELPNRRRLSADLADVFTTERRVCLAMFDLNGFKGYNDAFGHVEGDLLLQRLGRRLARALPLGGAAYRLGGDEFCVLLSEDTDTDRIIAMCTAALTETGDAFHIGASVGRASIPTEAASPTDALQLADQRMYADKTGERASARQQASDLALAALAEHQSTLHEHLTGVADLARAIGLRMKLEPVALGNVVRTAELHDVGKLAIADAILNKPGPLDENELRLMRRHTVIGERILEAAPALQDVARLVRSTHERVDGRGYPDGLAGTEIPLASRIVFVCDAFDAMTHARPYQAARSREEALAELERCAGTEFDPDVVRALVSELADVMQDQRRTTSAQR